MFMTQVEELIKEVKELRKQVEELTKREDDLEDVVADVPSDIIVP